MGLASSGLHTNGYSLARKVFFEVMGKRAEDRLEALGDRTIGDILLDPHRSYLAPLKPLLAEGLVHAMAHITGGGFYENIPRVLPEGLGVVIRSGSWFVPPVFRLLQRVGQVSFEEMHRVFNMGIGMVLFVDPGNLRRVEELLSNAGQQHNVIGEVLPGRRDVVVESS